MGRRSRSAECLVPLSAEIMKRKIELLLAVRQSAVEGLVRRRDLYRPRPAARHGMPGPRALRRRFRPAQSHAGIVSAGVRGLPSDDESNGETGIKSSGAVRSFWHQRSLYSSFLGRSMVRVFSRRSFGALSPLPRRSHVRRVLDPSAEASDHLWHTSVDGSWRFR